MKDFFKPDDFDHMIFTDHTIGQVKKVFCDFANEKLQKLIEPWFVVHSYGGVDDWFIADRNNDTVKYKARIAFIEEIVKEPCKHSPIHILKNMCQSQVLTAGKVGFNFFNGWVCQNCGVELVAEWNEKK